MSKIRLLITFIGLLGMTLLGVGISSAEATSLATLHSSHVGSTNPGFTSGTCPLSGWGWHFVLPGNETTFVSISVSFANQGTVSSFTSFPTGKHAYVYTSGPDTLLGASAQVNGPQTSFNLSHVCTGTSGVTTTRPAISTTSPPTTTKTPVVTTTVVGITSIPSTTVPVVKDSIPTPTVPERGQVPAKPAVPVPGTPSLTG